MADEKKIIAVVGATGAQGGGLAWAILDDRDSEFAVRALTRKPDSEKARALRDAGVRHVVWSTFEDTRKKIPLSDDRMPTLMGKYKVAHFDAKAEADDEFRSRGVPTTFLYTSFYWDNMIGFGMHPQRGDDGKL